MRAISIEKRPPQDRVKLGGAELKCLGRVACTVRAGRSLGLGFTLRCEAPLRPHDIVLVARPVSVPITGKIIYLQMQLCLFFLISGKTVWLV